MRGTILPPPEEEPRNAITSPPERSRDSTMPPADLGPMGLALRLLALEQQVADIHAETFGISKAHHDMKNAVVVMSDGIERMARALEILQHDLQGQRLDRARLLDDVETLKVLLETERRH